MNKYIKAIKSTLKGIFAYSFCPILILSSYPQCITIIENWCKIPSILRPLFLSSILFPFLGLITYSIIHFISFAFKRCIIDIKKKEYSKAITLEKDSIEHQEKVFLIISYKSIHPICFKLAKFFHLTVKVCANPDIVLIKTAEHKSQKNNFFYVDCEGNFIINITYGIVPNGNGCGDIKVPIILEPYSIAGDTRLIMVPKYRLLFTILIRLSFKEFKIQVR